MRKLGLNPDDPADRERYRKVAAQAGAANRKARKGGLAPASRLPGTVPENLREAPRSL